MTDQLNKQIANYIETNRNLIIKQLGELVSIPSVSVEPDGIYPFGEDCAEGLKLVLKQAEEHGFTATNHNYYYGTAVYTNPKYYAGEKTIGIFAHIDVVPDGNGWAYSPFEMTEKDGYLIGRGVSDNKNAAIVGMHVMRCIHELDIPFKSKISLYFGCSEETGMLDIEQYVKEQPMPDFSIVPDTNFPVCHGEKGIMGVGVIPAKPFKTILDLSGGLASNMVADAATATLPMDDKMLADLLAIAATHDDFIVFEKENKIIATTTGVATHAALPEGSVNAITLLAEILVQVDIHQDDKDILSVLLETNVDSYGTGLGIDLEDQPSGKLTCINGMVRTVDKLLSVDYNIRYPVTDKGSRCEKIITDYFKQKGWNTPIFSDSAPAYVPKDDPKITLLCNIYENITGKDSTPYVMGGGTYSRHLKNAVGFGMETHEPMPFPAGHGGVHQPDEAIKIETLMEALKIYIISLIEIDNMLHK